ncbi:hypothetical protein ANANG_G00147670 [Anguilla anguilla]|uniref:CUB domain-containing protein n=1 Tax=Anguilla anguilla TaxID=7936 RepID=A0A9D3S0U7_ANGAN|nr:hypothetical protein ANANG_G00147670 [Anguilla anguilla]
MTAVSCIRGILCILCVTVCRSMELASASVRCERTPRILQGRQGEIRSSTHHSWSSRQLNCSWVIPASPGEPVILSCLRWSWGSLLHTTSSTRVSPTACASYIRMLELGPGDVLTITDQRQGQGSVLKTITCASNYKVVEVESRTGLLSLTYRMLPGSEGRGFNATYRIAGYCLLREGRGCVGAGGDCFTAEQRCDGRWDCPETGRDEMGCWGCPEEECNYQLYCADGTDEKACVTCRPGTFHCDSDRCVFESWRCDGQVDCKDGTDEANCTVTLPRKVITAATLGSLVCGLLLVIAMGCTCKLYSLRTREYSMFAPITRQEAELIQQQAPPSYGQLIAQGAIPPVEDFPTENPNEPSSLSLRGLLQLLGQDPGPASRRRRRPRFVRRAIRRLRRWGLLPRSGSRATQTAGSSPQPVEATPTEDEVLLIPLSEDTPSEEDVPMLT